MSEAQIKTGRARRILQKLLISTCSVLLLLTIFELMLRFAGFGNLEIYQPDPLLYWKLKPNQDCYTKIDHKPVHINSQGTRGPEFQVPKPAGTVRVLCIGDSRTFGWGLSKAETYAGRLEKLLQEKVGSRPKIEVINAGVNGWSYPQMLVYFREIGLGFQPDVVILADANGWTQFSEKNSPDFVRKFMWRVRLKNLLRRSALYHYVLEVQLKNFYERHRAKFIPVDPKQDTFFKEQQQNDPDAVFRAAIEEFSKLALSRGVKPTLLYVPTLDELKATNTAAVCNVKRETSEKLKVPFVDMRPALQSGGKALYLEGDPVHLNAAGNEVIARELFSIVSGMVGQQ